MCRLLLLPAAACLLERGPPISDRSYTLPVPVTSQSPLTAAAMLFHARVSEATFKVSGHDAALSKFNLLMDDFASPRDEVGARKRPFVRRLQPVGWRNCYWRPECAFGGLRALPWIRQSQPATT